MKEKMKGLVIIGLMGSFALLNSGCVATFMEVKNFNGEQDEMRLQHTLKARANNNGAEARASIDVSNVPELAKGYWSAWKNSAGPMAKAAAIDTAWMGAAYYLYEDAKDSSSDSKGSTGGGISITAGGDVSGDIIQNNGDGNTVFKDTSEFAGE